VLLRIGANRIIKFFNEEWIENRTASVSELNLIIGVSGFIVPDDRVDVIVTTTPPGVNDNKDARLSKIVLQNKRVLSVAQSTEQKDGKPPVARSITLEVSPEEAEKLSLAYQEGPIGQASVDSYPTKSDRRQYGAAYSRTIENKEEGSAAKPFLRTFPSS
jgi:Flp pilus assembly protein CpaB